MASHVEVKRHLYRRISDEWLWTECFRHSVLVSVIAWRCCQKDIACCEAQPTGLCSRPKVLSNKYNGV